MFTFDIKINALSAIIEILVQVLVSSSDFVAGVAATIFVSKIIQEGKSFSIATAGEMFHPVWAYRHQALWFPVAIMLSILSLFVSPVVEYGIKPATNYETKTYSGIRLNGGDSCLRDTTWNISWPFLNAELSYSGFRRVFGGDESFQVEDYSYDRHYPLRMLLNAGEGLVHEPSRLDIRRAGFPVANQQVVIPVPMIGVYATLNDDIHTTYANWVGPTMLVNHDTECLQLDPMSDEVFCKDFWDGPFEWPDSDKSFDSLPYLPSGIRKEDSMIGLGQTIAIRREAGYEEKPFITPSFALNQTGLFFDNCQLDTFTIHSCESQYCLLTSPQLEDCVIEYLQESSGSERWTGVLERRNNRTGETLIYGVVESLRGTSADITLDCIGEEIRVGDLLWSEDGTTDTCGLDRWTSDSILPALDIFDREIFGFSPDKVMNMIVKETFVEEQGVNAVDSSSFASVAEHEILFGRMLTYHAIANCSFESEIEFQDPNSVTEVEWFTFLMLLLLAAKIAVFGSYLIMNLRQPILIPQNTEEAYRIGYQDGGNSNGEEHAVTIGLKHHRGYRVGAVTNHKEVRCSNNKATTAVHVASRTVQVPMILASDEDSTNGETETAYELSPERPIRAEPANLSNIPEQPILFDVEEV